MKNMEDVERIVKEEGERWLKEEGKEAVLRKAVRQQLRAGQERILAKILGFDLRYDKAWQLDHCNGRAGQSEFGLRLTSAAQVEVDKWMEKICKRFPPINQALIDAAVREYQTMFERRLRDRARNLAEETVASFSAQDLLALLEKKPEEGK